MFAPQLILHPTDYSDSSQKALGIAVDLAQHYAASLIVLHVVETLGPDNVTVGQAATELQPDAYQQRLHADLERWIQGRNLRVQPRLLLAEGDPAHEIERVARAEGCDLLVLGTHGRTGLRRLLMGSIAEQVLRRAPCPVLIVKCGA